MRPLGGFAPIFTPNGSGESGSGESSFATRIARLKAAGLEPRDRLPAELDPAASALVESPEGTRLLLLGAEL